MNRLGCFCLLFSLVLFSCCQQLKKEEAVFIVDLYETKKIVLPVDERTYYLSHAMFQFEKDGKEYLHFENTNLGQYNIVVFDIEEQKEVKKIFLQNAGPDATVAVRGSRFLRDSVYMLFQNSIGRISMIDDQSQLLGYYNAYVEDEGFLYLSLSSYFYTPTFIKDSVLYFESPLFKPNIKKEEWSSIPMFVGLDLKSGQVYPTSIHYPRLFDMNVKNPSGGYNFSYDYNHKDNRLVCSFIGYDSLMVSDDLKGVKWYDGKSRYLPSLRPILPETSAGIRSLTKLKERGRYLHIMYDKYRDVYYRFVEHPISLEANETPYEEPGRREFSVIVFNNKFEIIGETKFPGNKYFDKMCFVGKDGLYISENNLDNPEFDENKLVFACFALKNLK